MVVLNLVVYIFQTLFQLFLLVSKYIFFRYIIMGSATIPVHVLCEVHPRSVLAAFSPCCQVINLSLFLAFVACLWLHEWGGRTWTWQGGSEVGAGEVQRGPASEDCNKSGQDMDMSLLLLRLERLGHLKIAAGLQATTSRQVPHPQPLLPYSAPPLIFLPAPLSRQVSVCVFRSCANFLWLEENNPQVADTLVCVWQCQLGRLQAAKCTCPAFPWPLPDPTPLPPFWHTHVSQSQPFFS